LNFHSQKHLYQECSECYHELLWPHSCASGETCSCFRCFLLSFIPSPQRAFQQHIHMAHTSDVHSTEKSRCMKSSEQFPFHHLKHSHQDICQLKRSHRGTTQPLLLGLPEAGGELLKDTSHNVTSLSLACQKEPVSDNHRDGSSLPFAQIQPSIRSACFAHSNPRK